MIRLGWLAIASLLVFSVFAFDSAYGHAYPVRSIPGSGEQVSSLPSELVIHWTEGVVRGEIAVLDSTGERIDRGSMIRDPINASVTSMSLMEVEGDEGIYTVRWWVIAEDTHLTEGTFFFIVGDALPTREQFLEFLAGSAEREQMNPYDPLLRWLLFMSMVVLVGAPITIFTVVNPIRRTRSANKGGSDTAKSQTLLVSHSITKMKITRYILMGSAIVLLVSATLLALNLIFSIYQALSFDNILSFVTETTFGSVWITRLALGIGFITLLFLVRRYYVWLAAAIAVGIGTQMSISITSHSASMIGGIIPVLMDFGHLLGASLWAGGLVTLAILIPSLLKEQQNENTPMTVSRLIRRFSPIAIAGVALAGATGFILTSWHVPNYDAMLSTLYGTSLTIKLILVIGAVAFGVFNRFIITKRLSGTSRISNVSTFVKSVRVELLIVVAVLFFAGVLTSVPTAVYSYTPDRMQEQLILVEQVDGVDVLLQATPFQAGLNVFGVQFTRGGEPAERIENTRILVQHREEGLDLPPLIPDKIEEGFFSTLGVLPIAGEWNMRVSAFVDGRFVAYTFSAVVLPAEHEHMEHEAIATDESFQRSLEFGTLAIIAIAIAVVAYELYQKKRVTSDEVLIRRSK